MNFARKAGVLLLSGLLVFFLYSAANTTAITSAFGDRQAIKDSLDKSKVYDKVVDGIVNQVSNPAEAPGQEAPQIDIDKDVLRQIAQDSLPPEYLKTNFEKVVDGTFNWLEGKTDKPDFTVDLTDAKNRMIDGTIAYAKQRTASLPVCTKAQLAELNQDDLKNPLVAPCRVPGYNFNAEIDKQAAELRSSESFLKDTVITADDIGGQDDQKSFFEDAKDVPRVFSLAQSSPLIFGALILLSAIGVVFLSADKRTGLRRVKRLLIGVGAFIFVFALAVQFLIRRVTNNLPGQTGTEEQLIKDVIFPLVNQLVGRMNKVYLIFGTAYLLVALIITVLMWQMNKKVAPATVPAKPKK